MLSFIFTAALLTLVSQLPTSQAHLSYKTRIPNGDRVPNPCPDGTIWGGVGHQSPAGSNARNPFGQDFASVGRAWTMELCRKDSDGDGMTNGQELGDPDCVWRPGATPARTTGLSHPGICPLDSTTCTNTWTVCPKPFSCPAMNDANVTVRNFTVHRNTPVPAKETTYMCQAFELNSTATPVHMIGSKPLIDNKNVMHHMIVYACNSKPAQHFFDGPQECFMGNSDCSEILNLWAYGIEGECFNSNAGVRVGGHGFRYALLELHWNNPEKRADYTDNSGFSIYFTSSLRRYDQGTLMYGEADLVLPPRQPMISVNHTCPSVCTNAYHPETRYITAATIHMHTFGIKGRISLWRNGTLIKDLSPLQVYDYNSPEMHIFDPPIEYRKGDEVKTECYFSTIRNNNTIFWGFGTLDEMCFSFLTYYPNNVMQTNSQKLGWCLGVGGINECWVRTNSHPHVEHECNITAMRSGAIPNQVYSDMMKNSCFDKTGCHPTCRNYLNNTLWPSNACYDPRRARQMAELMARGLFVDSPVNATIYATLYGQRFCQQEIDMLAMLDRQASNPTVTATTAVPTGPRPTGGLTSEHLLIVIIVCSCLAFIIIIAVLVVLATKLQGGSLAGGAAAVSSGRATTYKVYENQAMTK